MKTPCLVGVHLVAFVLLGCGSSATEAPMDAGKGDTGAGIDAQVTSEAGSDGGASGPIPQSTLTQNAWTWVPVEGDICRDGSPTGIGVNLGAQADKLMIYLEGGGACFNQLTCDPTRNPAFFGEKEFAAGFVGASGAHASTGIFNRGYASNPVKDWTFVYVPYCTGDVHAGNRRDSPITGVTGAQQFVGYVNVQRDLQRLVPSFQGLSKVLLTGISAGGFGAATNYGQVAKAFGKVPVYMLDDSGPPMGDPYLAKCLTSLQSTAWGFDKTILAECGADCPDPTNFALDLTRHVGKAYPNIPFGLIESTDDGVITQFFGFGASNCTTYSPLTEETFTAGLATYQAGVKDLPNFGSFILGDARKMQHTSLGGDSTFQEDTTAADTLMLPSDGGAGPEAGASPDGGVAARIKLVDWIAQLIGGATSNVGP